MKNQKSADKPTGTHESVDCPCWEFLTPTVDRCDCVCHTKKPTGLTDEQIDQKIDSMWAHAYQMSIFERKELRGLCREIEAIVQKDRICLDPKHPDCYVILKSAFNYAMAHSAREAREEVVNGTLMAMEAACKGAADRARKDERERAANICWDLHLNIAANAILRDEK